MDDIRQLNKAIYEFYVFLDFYTTLLYRLPGVFSRNDPRHQPMLMAMISLVEDVIIDAKQPLMTSH